MADRLTSAEIFDTAQQATSRAAFRAVILARLQESIGADIAIFHEIAPTQRDMKTVIGITENVFEKAREANGTEYAMEIIRAAQGGRAVVDIELFGRQKLARFPFYDEVLRPTGLACVQYGLVQFRGGPPSFIAFGRGRASTFPTEVLEQNLPTLILADAALASAATTTNPAWSDMTRRQQELVSYVGLGLTNTMIATAMGTSPNTVRNQLAALYKRFGVGSRAELLHYLMTTRAGVITGGL